MLRSGWLCTVMLSDCVPVCVLHGAMRMHSEDYPDDRWAFVRHLHCYWIKTTKHAFEPPGRPSPFSTVFSVTKFRHGHCELAGL